MTKTQSIGLVAGWGDYPLEIAKRLHHAGQHVICVGLKHHTDRRIADYCTAYREFGLGRFASQIRFLKKHGIRQATMAGKVFKTRLLHRWAWIHHRPDWLFWRYFYRQFLLGTENRNDDRMLTTVTRLYGDQGIDFVPATQFAPELLVKAGLLTKRKLTNKELNDIRYGWMLAKSMGELDVGQSVAVKGRAVLAVEAIEGTDECIRRAGQLCAAGGFTVVKVAKPQQDLRFDMPTVGVGTIQSMKAAGAKVLAVEAAMTIGLNQPEMLQLAEDVGISIVALNAADYSGELDSLATTPAITSRQHAA